MRQYFGKYKIILYHSFPILIHSLGLYPYFGTCISVFVYGYGLSEVLGNKVGDELYNKIYPKYADSFSLYPIV